MALNKREWLTLAKYNLVLWIVFGLIAIVIRGMAPSKSLLLIENGALSLIFLGIMTLCTIQASLPRFD